MDAYENFAYGTVATAPSPATTGTSLIVGAGQGALFPAAPFNVVVWPTGSQPNATNAEIVRVTNKSTDTFTITREQEGTSARTIVVGDQVAAAWTAKFAEDITTDIADAIEDMAPGVELDYTELTSSDTATATTEGGADVIITGGAVTYDGSTEIMVEFFAGEITHSASDQTVTFVLYDNGSSIGMLGRIGCADLIGNGPSAHFLRKLTPSAASHTYSVRAFVASGTGTVVAGAGGSGNRMPAFLRIMRA